MKNDVSPHPIDIHVGARIRLRRLVLRMSQEELATRIGVTFQQVQKYEKGFNRISCSRLVMIANALSAPATYFFEGAPGARTESAEDETDHEILTMLQTPTGFAISRAFLRIGDTPVRQQLVALAEEIAAIEAARSGN